MPERAAVLLFLLCGVLVVIGALFIIKKTIRVNKGVKIAVRFRSGSPVAEKSLTPLGSVAWHTGAMAVDADIVFTFRRVAISSSGTDVLKKLHYSVSIENKTDKPVTVSAESVCVDIDNIPENLPLCLATFPIQVVKAKGSTKVEIAILAKKKVSTADSVVYFNLSGTL